MSRISEKKCSIEGCDRPMGRRGWCDAHYWRWWKNGHPLAGRTSPGEPLRYLREEAVPFEGDECLIWPFVRNSKGYGQLKIDGVIRIASRVVCEYVNGPPPSPSHEAAHKCGKGHEGCVNPRHLEWKTHTANLEDRIDHGTMLRGARHSQAKLNEQQVLAIRALKGTKPYQSIADEFGVSRQTVGDILTGRRWGWL